MGYIKQEFDKICRTCIIRFSELLSVRIDEVQIVLFLKFDKALLTAGHVEALTSGKVDKSLQEVFTTGYLILKKYQLEKEISVKELINRKVDFMGKSYLLSQKIRDVIIELCSSEKMQPETMRILIYMKGQEIKASLYSGSECKKQLDLGDVLNDLKMLQNEMQ